MSSVGCVSGEDKVLDKEKIMNVDDTIQCHDTDDLINTMIECARSGIETDFDYSEDKPRLIVTAIKEEEQCQK